MCVRISVNRWKKKLTCLRICLCEPFFSPRHQKDKRTRWRQSLNGWLSSVTHQRRQWKTTDRPAGLTTQMSIMLYPSDSLASNIAFKPFKVEVHVPENGTTPNFLDYLLSFSSVMIHSSQTHMQSCVKGRVIKLPFRVTAFVFNTTPPPLFFLINQRGGSSSSQSADSHSTTTAWWTTYTHTHNAPWPSSDRDTSGGCHTAACAKQV